MYVCMYVCIFIKLHITAQSGPALSSESFYATRIDPPKGGSMILYVVCMHVCMYVSSSHIIIAEYGSTG